MGLCDLAGGSFPSISKCILARRVSDDGHRMAFCSLKYVAKLDPSRIMADRSVYKWNPCRIKWYSGVRAANHDIVWIGNNTGRHRLHGADKLSYGQAHA